MHLTKHCRVILAVPASSHTGALASKAVMSVVLTKPAALCFLSPTPISSTCPSPWASQFVARFDLDPGALSGPDIAPHALLVFLSVARSLCTDKYDHRMSAQLHSHHGFTVLLLVFVSSRLC